MRTIRILAVTLTVAMTAVAWGEAADFYISPAGNDGWSGTLAQPNASATDGPFGTLERARDAIRGQKARGPLPAGGVTVELRGGTYELAQPAGVDRSGQRSRELADHLPGRSGAKWCDSSEDGR